MPGIRIVVVEEAEDLCSKRHTLTFSESDLPYSLSSRRSSDRVARLLGEKTEAACYFAAGSANATTESPCFVPSLPWPPAQSTTYCVPRHP